MSATSGTVDINTIGTYTIDYTYTNSQGASSTVTRTVNVVPQDNVAPVVSLVGSGNINVALGSTWSDSGATWSDNVRWYRYYRQRELWNCRYYNTLNIYSHIYKSRCSRKYGKYHSYSTGH
jgi:Domain of unknown function (DUF5011)